ncbi:SNED1 protein, partial [Nyctibius bracteatus]|nr:SNED1 protein [Nyctibius bracteatus]
LLYPYGLDQGDQKNPKLDDGTSKKVSLAVPFTFYGKDHRSLYVRLHPSGAVVGRSMAKLRVLDPIPPPHFGSGETININQYLPKIPFTATWAFVATWDHVAYYGSTTNKVRWLEG